MNSYTFSVEVGFEVLRENLKCPESIMLSYISSVEVGFEDLSENLISPQAL